MTSQTEWANTHEFRSELLDAVYLTRSITQSLWTVDEDLRYLLKEIDGYRSKRPEICEMRGICSGCIFSAVQAIIVADELRSKHEQLFEFFARLQTSTAKPYDLAFQIQALHGNLFSKIWAMQMSLQEAELQFRSLERARKSQTWLRRIVACIRDLLTLAAPATGFIPYVGPVVGAVCGIGASLATVVHARIEPEQASQFSNLRAAFHYTVDTRNTLGNIMSCQSFLNNTTNHALYMMAYCDAIDEMSAPGRQTHIHHKEYTW